MYTVNTVRKGWDVLRRAPDEVREALAKLLAQALARVPEDELAVGEVGLAEDWVADDEKMAA